MQGLGYTRPFDGKSEATGISRDGQAIYGYSRNANGFAEAFLWRSNLGMTVLPPLAGSTTSTEALAVSADGSFVVGDSGTGSQPTAVLWHQGSVLSLGTASGFTRSMARSGSDQGGGGVGIVSSRLAQAAGGLTPSHGMETMPTYLSRNG